MFSVHHLIGPTFHQFWDSFSRTLGVMKVGCRPETQSISMGSPAHSLSSVMGQMFNNLGAFQMDEILYFAYGCLPLVQRCSQLIWISLRCFWQCHKQLPFLGLVYGYHFWWFWGWFVKLGLPHYADYPSSHLLGGSRSSAGSSPALVGSIPSGHSTYQWKLCHL